MYNTFKVLRHYVHRATLKNWGATRWYECLIPIFWLYERRPESWLLELVELLSEQGINHKRIFERWHYTEIVHD